MRVEISESAHSDVLDVCLEAATSIRGGFFAILFPYFRGGASQSRLTRQNAAKQSSVET